MAGIIGIVTPVAAQTVGVLQRSGLDLGPGLSEDQIADIQATYGFTFKRDHADVLRQVTPQVWLDWLGDEGAVRYGLAWPVEGVMFDVVNTSLWMPTWGERPANKVDAVEVARRCLATVPLLVPILGHRCIPAAPEPSGSPIFSAYHTDVIYYGTDLADYCAHEFLGVSTGRARRRKVSFWSDLADGVGGVQFW